MFKVICTLPNASKNISGVDFSEGAEGMVSGEVHKDVALLFAGIPGYHVIDVMPKPAPAPAKSKDEPAPEKGKGKADKS